MNVSLTSEMEKFIAKQVKSGQYQTASEVVREALRMLKDRQQFRQMKLHELRKEIQVAIDQIDRGEYSDWNAETIKAEGRRILAQRHQRKQKKAG